MCRGTEDWKERNIYAGIVGDECPHLTFRREEINKFLFDLAVPLAQTLLLILS